MHSYYRLELSFQKLFSTQCLEILIWEKSLIDCKLAIVSFIFSGLQIDLSIIFSFHLMFRSLDVPFSGAVHVAALRYRFSEIKRSRVLVAQCWRLTSNFYEVTHEVTSWTNTGWFVNGYSLMSSRCPPSPKNKITKRRFRHCSQEDWSFHHLKSLLPEHTQQTNCHGQAQQHKGHSSKRINGMRIEPLYIRCIQLYWLQRNYWMLTLTL